MPVWERVSAPLKAAGLRQVGYDQVGMEPTDKSIGEAVEFARDVDWECVVAVGGGSAMDTAKAVKLLTSHSGELLDFITPPIGRGEVPTQPMKPLIATPTTAGTGAESTTMCVVDTRTMHLKAGISHPSLRPDLALIDPATTLTLPPEVTPRESETARCARTTSGISRSDDRYLRVARPELFGVRDPVQTCHRGCHSSRDGGVAQVQQSAIDVVGDLDRGVTEHLADLLEPYTFRESPDDAGVPEHVGCQPLLHPGGFDGGRPAIDMETLIAPRLRAP